MDLCVCVNHFFLPIWHPEGVRIIIVVFYRYGTPMGCGLLLLFFADMAPRWGADYYCYFFLPIWHPDGVRMLTQIVILYSIKVIIHKCAVLVADD